MSTARVHSLQVLKDAKAAVADFGDAVKQTLASVDADINRITQWLSQDRPAYWKAQVRRREEEIAQVQSAIMRKKIIAAPEPASIVEEQKALEKAKQRLGAAQKRLENVRRWAPIWEKEALLYKTACRGLAEAVHRDMPAAGVRLESLMNSLEAYLRIAAPRADDDTPVTASNNPEQTEQAEQAEQGEPTDPGDSAQSGEAKR